VLRRKLSVLLTAVMTVMATMAASPAFADHSVGHTQAQGTRSAVESCLANPSGPGVSECAQPGSG